MPLPYVLFVFWMLEVISSSFRSLRTGSQVFALLMVLCVDLHTMSSGKSLQFIYMVPFSAISMMFVKILLSVCMLEGMVV